MLIGKNAVGYYGKNPIKFKISDLSSEPANALPAYLKAPSHFTVVFHYAKKQNICLKFPNWPCLIQDGSGGHRSYFPLELLFILN